MSLINPQHLYTQGQQEALTKLYSFIRSDFNCFILNGYAGTGKTFLIKNLVEYLNSERYAFKLMAPTGRAAMILAEKTGFKATTIHRAIYNLSELSEINIKDKKSFKFKYKLKPIDITNSIYIVDESSMVSDTYCENEFAIYGSGRLLNDLLTHCSRSTKVIFVGDSAQLPPVTDNFSMALTPSYLEQQYELTVQEYELTEVVRQKADSGILHMASYIRNKLSQAQRNSFQIDSDQTDINIINTQDVVKKYIESNPEKELNKAIIINHSNQKSYDYNMAVRELLFNDKNTIEPGDILIIQANNYNYQVDLLNGMLVRVKQVAPDRQMRVIKSYDEKGQEITVQHLFRKITIEIPCNGTYVDQECLILENYLHSPNANLTYAESTALYIDFKIRNPTLKPDSAEFRDALKTDPYFNALRVKYGYAITCHKAQGGEWDSVFINMDVHIGILSDSFLRWAYTAVTRSKKKLFLYNVSQTTQFSNFQFNFQLLPSETQANGLALSQAPMFYVPEEEIQVQIEKFGLTNAQPFQRHKFIEIWAKAASKGYKVLSRTTHNFQDRYLFEQDGVKAGIIFWYNSKNEYTKQTIAPQITESNDLAKVISELMAAPVTINMTSDQTKIETTPIEFDDKHKELTVLYDYLTTTLSKNLIQISQIKHFQYQEVYHFARNQETAVLRFYYDGKSCFKSGEPVLKECNSNQLLKDIYNALKDLKPQKS